MSETPEYEVVVSDSYAVDAPSGDTDLSGDASTLTVGVYNDASISFDFSDQSTSETVDAFYISDGAGNLYATAAMTQSRDIGAIDSLDVAIGDLEITVD